MLALLSATSVYGMIFGFALIQLVGFVVSVFTDGYAKRICIGGLIIGLVSTGIFALTIYFLTAGKMF